VRSLWLLWFIPFISVNANAETHPEVQAALDWTLPQNVCEQPESIYGQKIVDPSGDVTETSAKRSPAEERLYKRKKRTFDKCIESYKQGLLKDFGSIREVAQYGLTQEQADQLLNKLKFIQSVIKDPLALPPVVSAGGEN